MTFTTVTRELGSWVRADYTVSPDAPHKRYDWLPWEDPMNQLGIVYADAERRVPLLAEDGDGCQAAIL